MIQIRRAEDRGQADHGWLQARFSFSFADYYDPGRMGYGTLRVLNQDRVAAGRGFPAHPHRDMEIVTVVLQGRLRHEDSMGHRSTMGRGDVQLMSAGRGVRHSEFNDSDEEELRLLQIWVMPRHEGGDPRYEQRDFSTELAGGGFHRVVDPEARDAALTIDQDATFWLGHLGLDGPEEATLSLAAGRRLYLHVAEGTVRIGDEALFAGDGATVEEETSISVTADSSAVVIAIDLD